MTIKIIAMTLWTTCIELDYIVIIMVVFPFYMCQGLYNNYVNCNSTRKNEICTKESLCCIIILSMTGEGYSRLKRVLDTTLCNKVCQWLPAGRWFSPVSSTNKTDLHDTIEILWNISQSFCGFVLLILHIPCQCLLIL
jgi:hypothetical protein